MLGADGSPVMSAELDRFRRFMQARYETAVAVLSQLTASRSASITGIDFSDAEALDEAHSELRRLQSHLRVAVLATIAWRTTSTDAYGKRDSYPATADEMRLALRDELRAHSEFLKQRCDLLHAVVHELDQFAGVPDQETVDRVLRRVHLTVTTTEKLDALTMGLNLLREFRKQK
jgi:hypothetical protein